MHEVDDELREIKREIIESRGLVIKTNNLTNEQRDGVRRFRRRRLRRPEVCRRRARRSHRRDEQAPARRKLANAPRDRRFQAA
jgi:hypothetical protein